MTGSFLVPVPAKPLRAQGTALLLCLTTASCVATATSGNPGTPGGSSGNPPAGGPKGTGGTTPPTTTVTGTGGGGVSVTTGTGGAAPVQDMSCLTPAVGKSPLRRLTHREYDNSVADLLGDKTQPALQFPPDTEIGLFDNTAEAQIAPVLLTSEYLDAAVILANGVANLTTLVGCDFAGTAGATCVRTFIQKFGRRAYRRPVTPEETTRLVALYDKALTDKALGVRAVITAMLVSPHFLFRPEFGSTTSTIPSSQRLTQFELAGRMASLLWASVPDDLLLDEAQAGRLATAAQVTAQVRRMLLVPRAKAAVAAFYDQWLGLSMLDVATKDTAVYQFDDQLRISMREETQRFVANVIWSDGARLSTLLTAPYSFLNAPLATLYGVTGPANATTYSKVMLDPTKRMGLLTQGSFLTAFARPDSSSPVKRGTWIRRRLLCGDLPDPPDNVPELPEIMDGVSNRDRFSMHVTAPGCATCHVLVDGFGFGLEAYDGIGRYRTADRGIPVDVSGEIFATTDINGKYSGAVELSALLARSTQVRDCAPTQWLRYGLARREGPEDACALKAVREGFAASEGNLLELMVTLTQTDAFMNYRRAD